MNQEERSITLEDITACIEAILYAAGHPVEYQKISDVLGLQLSDTKNIIEAMSKEYNSDSSKRGIMLL